MLNTRQEMAQDTCAPLSKLILVELRVTGAGVCCIYGRLEQTHCEAAAMSLACGIARRRLQDDRLFQEWHARANRETEDVLNGVDSTVMQAALLENVGSPSKPAMEKHFLGFVAETIWRHVITDTDFGLGIPIRVESHDWSVTDPGGDGLTVYGVNGQYRFRLWESKYHGHGGPLRDTVNNACSQVSTRAISYLARFSLVAQHLTEDRKLAEFYARLAELWADKDGAAGVGVVVGADSCREKGSDGCFEGITAHFELTADQHQGQLNLVDGFQTFAESVRRVLWRGCGLWTDP